jgi:hypothetical protein
MSFYVKDQENAAYYCLVFGINSNNVDSVKMAINSGANLKKVSTIQDYEKKKVFFSDEVPKDSSDLLSYCLENSSSEVYDLINQHLNPEGKLDKAFLKSLIIKKNRFGEPGDHKYKFNGSPILSELLKQRGVNDLLEIKSYYEPLACREGRERIQTTFLHIAVSEGNVDAVSALLENGADPNILDSQKRSTLDLVPVDKNKDKIFTIVKKLLDHGIKTSRDKNWIAICEVLQIPQLKEILKHYNPDDSLFGPTLIKSKSRTLYSRWRNGRKLHQKFKILGDIEEYEKKQVDFKDFYANKLSPKVKIFFKEKSLTVALKKRYNLKSPRLVNFVNTFVFDRSENNCLVDIHAIYVLDHLKSIFLEEKNENVSVFLDTLDFLTTNKSSPKYQFDKYRFSTLIEIMDSSNYRILLSLLKDNFTVQKTQIILKDFFTCEDHPEISDMVKMYKNRTSDYKTILKQSRFEDINSFNKIHDLFASHIEKLSRPVQKINQEKNFPKLKTLEKTKIKNKYTFKVAETNHELIDWGTQMSHCVGNDDFAEDARKGKCILFALCEKDSPKYCVEIRDGRNKLCKKLGLFKPASL